LSPSTRLKEEFLELSAEYKRLMELIRCVPEEGCLEAGSPEPHTPAQDFPVEGPRVSPRPNSRHGQLLAIWPPVRRSVEQDLRSELASMVRRHQEDQRCLQ
ncbi:unnamed protein product, partial [Effrenium voratum]